MRGERQPRGARSSPARSASGAARPWKSSRRSSTSGERATNSLRRYLRVFYAITTVGPLLGLMGTVLGMIQTFNVIAAGDALGRANCWPGESPRRC